MPAPDRLTGLRFDSVAEHYHQLRPRYPDAIWDALFDITGLSPGARVLEIGAGTGIATAELVHRGLHVTALEPGPDMAAMIDRDLDATGEVEIVVSRFDDWSAPGEPFDLVIGATSLHWIGRQALQRRLPELVKPGGHAALVHYGHVAGGDAAFFEAAHACYATHDPNFVDDHLRAPEDPGNRSRLLDDLPGFESVACQNWLVEIPSDRDHYLSLISTYSTTLRIPEPNRTQLLSCIGDLFDDRFGERITKAYRFDLVVTRRQLPAAISG